MKHPAHRIPRSMKAARRALKPVSVPFERFTDTEKANLILFEPPPRTTSSPCAIIPLENGRFKIQFIDPATGLCNGPWYESTTPKV